MNLSNRQISPGNHTVNLSLYDCIHTLAKLISLSNFPFHHYSRRFSHRSGFVPRHRFFVDSSLRVTVSTPIVTARPRHCSDVAPLLRRWCAAPPFAQGYAATHHHFDA